MEKRRERRAVPHQPPVPCLPVSVHAEIKKIARKKRRKKSLKKDENQNTGRRKGDRYA